MEAIIIVRRVGSGSIFSTNVVLSMFFSIGSAGAREWAEAQPSERRHWGGACAVVCFGVRGLVLSRAQVKRAALTQQQLRNSSDLTILIASLIAMNIVPIM